MSESLSSTSTFKPGTVLEDKWIIIELIGKGAMGEVYRAHQTNLKRDVAIKIISQDVLASFEDDPEELNIVFGRFQREVQAMAQVRHPNVLTIYDYGEIPNTDAAGKFHTAYIAMEYIPGNTLRFTMEEDGQDDDPELLSKWIANYFLPLLNGVEILHAHTIVHRDLKPENIFLDGEMPKIADLGLSRSYRMKALTCSVEMLGTLAYMSPEQCADFKSADFRSDIYALGKILYEAAQGTLTEKTLPFTAVSLADPGNDFLKALNTVLLNATNEKPEERYQSVQELRSGIKEALAVLEGEKRLPPKEIWFGHIARSGFSTLLGWTIGTVAILAVAAMAVYHLVDRQKPAGGPSLSSSLHQENSGYEPKVIELDPGEIPPSFMRGRDGSRMLLTSAPDDSEKKPLFYVDEEKISNFLFVEFLNSLGEAAKVDRGVVRLEEQIIFYISGSPGEAPIVYQHDTFHLSDQEKGIDPVVRVTYHGASLYAATYGKSLLTGKEWYYAYRYHASDGAAVSADKQVADQSDAMMSRMHGSAASPLSEESETGAGHNLGMNLKEWVRIEAENGGEETEQLANFYASGIMDEKRAQETKPSLPRLPWEGFDDVGFRTKISIQQQ